MAQEKGVEPGVNGMRGKPAQAPRRSMIARGDVRIEVLAQGEGKVIVLLPSLGRGATDFD